MGILRKGLDQKAGIFRRKVLDFELGSEQRSNVEPILFHYRKSERKTTELKIRTKLKEVMMKLDLDKCTTKDVRLSLERAVSGKTILLTSTTGTFYISC